ncbi:serine hydrolase domain-containing protein [Salisediminibacterium beveridgei]|uniref:Putative Beta-lactamase, class C n=1 Tax=Salisediminibacterium beveridgei TaxID=632773 RepID=A0A1D7QVD0_9BACI|nr:serine hydrolase [Salisediminibacterium beveridgei]AOM82974.1 putative Beta-lactamase, class C [Salisediminibacterium beveridgei]
MNTATFLNEIKKIDVQAVLISEEGSPVFQYEQKQGDIDRLHKVNSVTKSLLSLGIGIAYDAGVFPSVNEEAQSIFSDSIPANVLIKNLLTLSGGADPDQWWSYIKEERTFDQLISAYTNAQSHKMRYNNIDSHILCSALEYVTGSDPHRYLRDHLFNPLQIQKSKWEQDHLGKRIGGYGLMLSPANLSKIANLLLNEGRNDAEQLISPSWIQQSTRSWIETPQPNQSYGLHWWISAEAGSQPAFYYAAGMEGNFMVMIPSLGRSIVICSSLKRNESLKPFSLMLKYLLK